MTTTPSSANRLIREKSPYLLQHAHNPVDWYPWGQEALAKARQEQKLIFLSIGYSTCHWCHVMERESFENPAVAAVLNESFVPIKVDREERPDLDHLYMQAVMSLTGQGGWPLTVVLTLDLKPVFGGTYFPPEERWGRPGLMEVLRAIAQTWKDQPDRLRAAGDTLTQALRAEAQSAARDTKPLEPNAQVEAAVRALSRTADQTYGGLGEAPKFPRSHALSLLLRRHRDPQTLQIVEQALRAMAAGGMRDQLGGGFHRYSTDAQWRIPHFEKMLYDQALLARTYLEAYQITGKPLYAEVARDTFDYVLRDLTSPDGAFYSAEDADSADDSARPTEKHEGAFYVWTVEQVRQVLGADDATIIERLYGLQPAGNAIADPTGEFHGKNVVYQAHPVEAAQQALVARARQALLAARAARPRPHLDDKILVDWNGVMLASLAYGARVLDEPRYRDAAVRAADFLLKRLVRQDGRLLHRYRDGEAAILGMHDDYAFLIHGLVELYQATFEPRYLAEATRLTTAMLDLFWDDAGGGFFLTGRDGEALLVRQKAFYDGAIPAGNSLAALELLRLGRLTGLAEWEQKAQRTAHAYAAALGQHPTASPQMAIALDFAAGPSQEIAITGAPDHPTTQAMLRVVADTFLPNATVVLRLSPDTPSAVVCQNAACRPPVTSAAALRAQFAS